MQTKAIFTPEERRQVFEKAGIDLSKDITLSCAGGITCTTLYGGLKDIHTGRLAMYDGCRAEFSKAKK